MNAKTMEGLVGARTNMNLMNTPMRVFREAERRGDTAAMERAMGYACDFADKAEEYKTEADKGMEEDAKEAREKAKTELKKAIKKRREEREKLEEKILENKNAKNNTADTGTDIIEVSEEGRILLKDNTDLDNKSSQEIKTEAVKEPVMYTKTGKLVHAEQSTGISAAV